jgi:hypothetical protein
VAEPLIVSALSTFLSFIFWVRGAGSCDTMSLQWRPLNVLVRPRDTWRDGRKVTGGGKLKCPEEKCVVVPFCPALDFSQIEARNLRSETGA